MHMTLAARLAAGETVFTAWSSLPESLTVEALCAAPFDAITLDMQHGGHSDDSVLRCVAPIVSAKKPAIVRIPLGRNDMASRALDFGADAVIAPMINSADDAKAFAAAMKFPPLGERSWGVAFALARHGGDAPTLLAESNKKTMALAMIETRRAFEALDEILAVPGIDGVFVGPSDLSIAWTDGKRIAPTLEDMMGAIEHIAAQTRNAGKHAGTYLVDVSVAGRFVAMGYRFFAIGAEARLMAEGAKSLIGQAKATIG
jgi:4-hydroxy-2-oxoheptanedioate aldolase